MVYFLIHVELVRIIAHVNLQYIHSIVILSVYGYILQKFRVILKKNAYTEPIWQSLHLFFCNIFSAVENTLSDGAVDAGIAKYFLASLEIIGKDVS